MTWNDFDKNVLEVRKYGNERFLFIFFKIAVLKNTLSLKSIIKEIPNPVSIFLFKSILALHVDITSVPPRFAGGVVDNYDYLCSMST